MGANYNSELQKLHIGTTTYRDRQRVKAIQRDVAIQNIGYKDVEVGVIRLLLEANFTQPQEYKFGSHAILESMAYGIEQCLYTGIIKDNQDNH